jgi:hypothetical protein
MIIRIVALLVLTATFAVSARSAEPLDIKETLEGVWIEGRVPDKGDCVATKYDGETQLEFEFRKSGGRVMVFEPPDLFQAVQIAKVKSDGDGFTITARARDGALREVVRLRVLDRDRIETVSLVRRGDEPARPPVIIYRCGAPNRSVTGTLPMETLRLLTPETTLGAAYPLAIEGVDDRDICEGEGYVERLRAGIKQGAIQFEVLGPVRFWVSLYDVYEPRKIIFDHVRKVSQPGQGVLKLSMQEKARGAGWDAGRATYELTVIDKGSRFEIPEIGKAFIRCTPPRPGMHRWG